MVVERERGNRDRLEERHGERGGGPEDYGVGAGLVGRPRRML